jgi:hypothetical protein
VIAARRSRATSAARVKADTGGAAMALRALAAGLAIAMTPPAAVAAETEVDLELVLAVDVSLSMDQGEQKVQRDGYIAAFRHPDVIDAITSGLLGRIAVTYVEWAGTAAQIVRVPWTVIDGPQSAERFAAFLVSAPFERVYRTSISAVLAFAAVNLDANDYVAPRRVIDVSGDGANNQGLPVTAVRDAVVARGIVINGLPILTNPLNYDGFFDLQEIDIYYEDCVIGGTGAFIVPVTDQAQFATAIRRKLVLEIAQGPVRARPVAVVTAEPRIDCLVGEKMWNSWRNRQDE